MTSRLAIVLTFALGANQAMAASPGPLADRRDVTVRSRSGQFMVQGLPFSRPMMNLSAAGVAYVRLDPTVMAVTAENVKGAVLDALNMTDRWQSLVTLSLRPVFRDNEEIVIASVRHTDGWQFRMAVPEQVNKDRLLKALVEVVLLEIAQRNAGERRLELPPWLVPGLSAHLEANASSPLILEPETYTNRKRRVEDAVRTAREALRASGGLSLDDINWPREEINPAIYEVCSHLFVRELVRQGGGARISDMLSRLRDHYNWQTAFLQAFNFPSLRDVDKWWTLHLVQFAGRDSLSRWTAGEVETQLADILNTTVQVRRATNELPVTVQVPLDRLLAEWEFNRQEPVLRHKMRQLEVLRLRAPTNLVGIVFDYQQNLAVYLARRQRMGVHKPANAPIVKSLIADILQKLSAVDVRREIAVGGAPGTAAVSSPAR